MAIHSRLSICVAIAFAGLSACAYAGDKDLKLDLEPVIQGLTTGQGSVPIAAQIQNNGPDTRGILRVSSGGAPTDYPVELPRGADKRVVTYPTSPGGAHFSLITDKGTVDLDYAPGGDYGAGSAVLLISDTPGEMGFLRTSDDSSKPEIHLGSGPAGRPQEVSLLACYAKPGLAPTRPVGYSDISVVILGSGSERMTDEEVQALKLWVTTGGTLVFLGGASSPVLGDKRWSDMLPARDFHLAELKNSSVLLGLGASSSGPDVDIAAFPPITSVMTGTPFTGATSKKDGHILISAERPYGLGKTEYLSFNPFEAPLKSWDGRAMAMKRLLRSNTMLEAQSLLDSHGGRAAGSSLYTSTLVYASGSPSFPGGTPVYSGGRPPITDIENDPFGMRLPPTEQIFFILAGYFIVVVPVNFLLLKKLKRGELAWFTAPIISLGFAGVLFTSARSLYSAKMSTVSNGLIVAQEGNAEGLFIGTTQMFVPRAGSYDLKLKGVDSLGALRSNDYYGYSRYSGPPMDGSEDLEPTDVGEIKLPNMPTNNLAFRRIAYHQRLPISSWLHVKLTSTGPDTADCEVTNSSPYALRSASIVAAGKLMTIPDVETGTRRVIPVSFKVDSGPGDPGFDLPSLLRKQKRVALSGNLEGFRPGPQIGEEIRGRSSIEVNLFSAWNGGSQ